MPDEGRVMKTRNVTRVPNGTTVPAKKSTAKTPQGRRVESNFSSESARKAAKVGLVLLGIATLVYWSVCDIRKHDFCIPNDLTDIALNLDKVAALF